MVPLRALETPELIYEALRQAARRGTLGADRGSDGVWLSSGHAVATFREVRQRRSRDDHVAR